MMDQQNPENSRPQPSDAESTLLASALLEIRSDARRHAALSSSGYNEDKASRQQEHKVTMHVPPPKKAKVNNPIAPNVPVASHSPPLYAAPPSMSSYVPTMSAFTPEQLAALRAAAAASAVSFAAAASAANSPMGAFEFFRQASMGGAPLPGFHSQGPSAQAIAPMPAPLIASGLLPQTVAAQGSTTAEACAETIRREQVEAALNSKPQRGRKREDLSELERMELTRTRNREHAKSTRVRKKARHQELLDIEKQYEEIEHQAALQARRRHAICTFLRIRELMLHSVHSSDSSHSSGEHTAPTSNTTLNESWEDLVENASQFQFDEGWHKDDHHIPNSSERMKRFDEYVHSSVVAKFGGVLVPMLRYGIKGDQDGIALDASNGGLVEVELYLALHTKVYLMTGMVRFRFAAGTEKLQSVSHVHAMDLLASSERLNAQISYPSTVSLDQPAGHSDHAKPPDAAKQEDSGPGMNI